MARVYDFASLPTICYNVTGRLCVFCLPSDDPDSVPVEWRIWLAGQQRLPPNLVPVSGANSTLDRLEDVPIEEMHRGDAGASVAPMKAAVLGNLQASSGTGYRAYNPAKKKYEPESWSERDGGGVRKDNTNSQPQKK